MSRIQNRKVAEGEGFEPPVTCATTVFKTAALNRSATPPGSAYWHTGKLAYGEAV